LVETLLLLLVAVEVDVLLFVLVAVEVVVVVLLFVLVVVVALVVVNEFCSQYSLPAVQFPVWSALTAPEFSNPSVNITPNIPINFFTITPYFF
jgi:hypothetical protein